jgi:hypothetical protein
MLDPGMFRRQISPLVGDPLTQYRDGDKNKSKGEIDYTRNRTCSML